MDKINEYLHKIQSDDLNEQEDLNEFLLAFLVGFTGQMGYRIGLQNGMGYTAFLSIATAISYKVYKQYLTKAAKACKGNRGIEKEVCMIKHKKKATQKKIEVLKKAVKDCEKTNNVGKCKKKVQDQINREKKKLGDL